MESLSNIFKNSVSELENKLRCLVDEDYYYEQMNLKGNQSTSNDPLFLVEIAPNFEPIREETIKIEPLREFLPAPYGN